MMRVLWPLLLIAAALQADPRVDGWIRSTLPAGVQAVGPNVFRVSADARFVTVESAGLALQSFGALEVRPFDGARGVRRFAYRIPLAPRPAVVPAAIPLGVIGTFLNGVPIYNPAGVSSYRDQNLWHVDAVAQYAGPDGGLLRELLERGDAHSPLLGFALDGYPIYGPYGWDAEGQVRRFRSSYRARVVGARGGLGPAVGGEFPGGTFVEDYEYVAGLGDLDAHNGRFARTPEFPEGTYAYFLATGRAGGMAYPYLIGPTYFGEYAAYDAAAWKEVGVSEGLRLLTGGRPLMAGERVAFAVESPHAALERVHEKEMHVMVVSADLADFSHIHPEPVTRRFFAGEYVFPHAGSYWIFVDHTPAGGTQTVAKFRVTVGGTAHVGTAPGVEDVRAALDVDGDLRVGQDIRFRFTLTGVADGAVIPDLQPYLGARGHILFVRQEGDEVIHAHPLEAFANPLVHTHAAPGPLRGELETVTGFRKPGLYKLWLQVQRDGRVLTFPFVVRVAAAEARVRVAAVANAQVVTVSDKGFRPARIELAAGQTSRIVFRRLDAQNCAGRVVFPALGIDRRLPAGEDVLVEIPPQAAGELGFSCGMGMYRGAVVIR